MSAALETGGLSSWPNSHTVSNLRTCQLLEDGIYRKNQLSVLVIEMQPIMIPEFPRVYGENAIQDLHDFINELEEQRHRESAGKKNHGLD